jgi:uncharacterized protein GlcG (DUF336 family)/quercetin dioxygenase-like cupin family protein
LNKKAGKEMRNKIIVISSTLLFATISTFATLAMGQTVEKKTLTLQGAERVIAAAKAEAQKLQAPGGVIAVVDDGGNLMAVERLDGTFSAGANISIGKAKTAVMFKKPTRFFEELINSSGKGRTVMTALENFTPLIGGIPITVDGQIVGGVGVSGAASADQDEKLAIAGSNAFAPEAAMSSDPAPAVSYWEKSKVDEAFSKGAVLFDGSDGRNYMVHASRREKPGQAEIHTKDADVIYVLQGSATFITGGEALDGKTIAPGEIRGSSIKGGATRKIAKGDVIIVPHGVPHQFLEVTNPFLYYVVKVR